MNKATVLIQPNKELVKNFLLGKLEGSKDSVSYNMRNENKTSENELIDGIVGFKNYKINYLSEYDKDSMKKYRFDCDSSDLTMSILCYLIELDERVKEVLGFAGRYIIFKDVDNETHIVETDTINSLNTELNKFIRRIILKRDYRIDKTRYNWSMLYLGRYRIEDGKPLKPETERKVKQCDLERDKWLINNFNEIFDQNTLDLNDNEKLVAFEKLANYTHTIGNFMVGPVGFNVRKGAVFGDRLNVFFDEIQDEHKYPGLKEWFSENMSLNKLEEYFDEDKFESWNTSNIKRLIIGMNKNNNVEDITKEEIYNTVLIIENRGDKMLEALKEHKDFCDLFVKKC